MNSQRRCSQVRYFTLLLLALGALIASPLLAGEKLLSGYQPGESLAAFPVNDITGPNKGKTLCYV